MHAIVFDIDGTLLKSAAVDDELYRRAVSAVLGPVRFRNSLALYDHVTDSGILAQVLIDNGLADTRNPAQEIIAAFADHAIGTGTS